MARSAVTVRPGLRTGSEKGGTVIGLRQQLEKEQQRLAAIADSARRGLKDAPEGTLRLGKSQGCIQYYHCKEGAPQNGSYIPKKELKLVKELAQKSYEEKVLRYSEKTEAKIRRLLKNFEDNKIEKIYMSEHPERQSLINPVESTYQQRLDKWMATPFEGKGFAEDSPVILTNAGVRVRSKSEKIIADYLESVGIVYKYEYPLNLKSYGTIYPDFTFLSRRNGQEIYWEHEGMMDNPDYARTAVKKIELYEKNGIFPGEKLILTFESSSSIISSKLIKTLTNKYLL